MPIAKKHSNNIKPTDGRKGNGKNKQGIKAVQAKKASMTPAKLNQAKKDLIGTYALKAMKKVFGSEEEAWETLAEKAKDSFAHMNLLFQYRYGKPMDKLPENNQDKNNAPIINFFASPQQIHEMQETIDIDAEEVDVDELNEDN
jgi:hypothetical protein